MKVTDKGSTEKIRSKNGTFKNKYGQWKFKARLIEREQYRKPGTKGRPKILRWWKIDVQGHNIGRSFAIDTETEEWPSTRKISAALTKHIDKYK